MPTRRYHATTIYRGNPIKRIFYFGALLLSTVLLSHGSIFISCSGSIPDGVYKKAPVELANGSLVVFCPEKAVVDTMFSRGYINPSWFNRANDCPWNSPSMSKYGYFDGTITIDKDGISIDGELLENSSTYIIDGGGHSLNSWPLGEYDIAPDSFWAISTYNGASFDSRYFGPVPRDNIVDGLLPLLTE